MNKQSEKQMWGLYGFNWLRHILIFRNGLKFKVTSEIWIKNDYCTVMVTALTYLHWDYRNGPGAFDWTVTLQPIRTSELTSETFVLKHHKKHCNVSSHLQREISVQVFFFFLMKPFIVKMTKNVDRHELQKLPFQTARWTPSCHDHSQNRNDLLFGH